MEGNEEENKGTKLKEGRKEQRINFNKQRERERIARKRDEMMGKKGSGEEINEKGYTEVE